MDIYETPKEPFDRRSLGNARGVHKEPHVRKSVRQNKCFDVEEEYALRPGVYKIENADYIYIGSTTRRLSMRFSEHYNNANGAHERTHYILTHGGKFTCLESFDYNTDEDVIRDCEMKYICEYSNTNKTLINKRVPVGSAAKSFDYEYIKIPTRYFDEVVQCLNDNGFFVLEGCVYRQKDEV